MLMLFQKGDCDKPKVLRNATGVYFYYFEVLEWLILFSFLACGTATARIVGGADTLENQIPWQCNFYNKDDSWSVHFMIEKIQ